MALKSDKEIIILRIPGIFGYPRKSGLIYNIISNIASCGKRPNKLYFESKKES